MLTSLLLRGSPGRARAVMSTSTWLYSGDASLPPLVELTGAPHVPYVVKPPSVDDLWEWYQQRPAAARQRDPDPDPSWAAVWPAAVALAAHLATEPELVRGRSVVELGSGLGVTGLAAALAGARNVALVDREPLALHCALSSAERCGLSVGEDTGGGASVVSAHFCDWAEAAARLQASQGGADVVVASEVLYDKRGVTALVKAAAELRRAGSALTLLVADPRRERSLGCRASLSEEARRLGGRVGEAPLRHADGWALGREQEELILVRVDFPS